MEIAREHSFVGRQNELKQLDALAYQNRHVIISGSKGNGKSALLDQMRIRRQIVVCDKTSRLDLACRDLARQIHIPFLASTAEMKKSVIFILKRRGGPVAFDNVDSASLSVRALIVELLDQVPIWLVTQSLLTHGLGDFESHLKDFAHLEVLPLKKRDMRILMERGARCVLARKLRT